MLLQTREPLHVEVDAKTSGKYKCAAINRVTETSVEQLVEIDVQCELPKHFD